jgi:hypothetical protein
VDCKEIWRTIKYYCKSQHLRRRECFSFLYLAFLRSVYSFAVRLLCGFSILCQYISIASHRTHFVAALRFHARAPEEDSILTIILKQTNLQSSYYKDSDGFEQAILMKIELGRDFTAEK